MQRRRAERPDGNPPGISLAGIEAGRHREGLPGVLHRQREDRHRVERAAGRHHSARRDRSERRLQPDDVVQRRRHSPRPRRVGPEGEGHEPPRHRHRRPGGRPTRHDQGVQRIQRRRMRRPHTDESGGELVEVGLADRDCASRPAAVRPKRRRAAGQYEKAGQAAVVGQPATSILSLTAKGMPQSGRCGSKVAERHGRRHCVRPVHQVKEDPRVSCRLDSPVDLRDDRLRPETFRIGRADRGDGERQLLDHPGPCFSHPQQQCGYPAVISTAKISEVRCIKCSA